MLRDVAKRLLPAAIRERLARGGAVDMGDLRAFEPPSRLFGEDRGRPLCRWYIDRFLDEHRALVRGRVLEVAERTYTRQFGDDRVTESAVLHAVAGNPEATIVGDLATGEGIPQGRFDAVILSQTLQCVFDVHGAARTIHALLAPGGSALVTVPAIAPVSRYDVERWGEYWHFGEQSVRRLFEPLFGETNVRVASHGNHIVAHAYLAGMAAAEMHQDELLAHDPDYPILITAVATRG
ncbi:MAG: methyltransferase domain-containing protein [Gemmatimonadales bacterium]